MLALDEARILGEATGLDAARGDLDSASRRIDQMLNRLRLASDDTLSAAAIIDAGGVE